MVRDHNRLESGLMIAELLNVQFFDREPVVYDNAVMSYKYQQLIDAMLGLFPKVEPLFTFDYSYANYDAFQFWVELLHEEGKRRGVIIECPPALEFGQVVTARLFNQFAADVRRLQESING